MTAERTDAPTMPVWLTEDHRTCPSWCVADHRDRDAYTDREHVSETIALTLTAEEMWSDEDSGTTMPGAEDLPHVNLHLIQHYREGSSRIWVGKGGTSKGFYLTVAEADALAAQLRDLVENDEQARRAGSR